MAETAEILRERETPAVVEQAPPAPPPPQRSEFGDLAQQIVGRQVGNIAEQKGLAERRSAEVGPKIAEAAAGSEGLAQTIAANPPPSAPTLPPPPSRRLHEFLAPTKEESPENAIGKFIQALGLLATGFTGAIKGDARGSLAAISGAMQGWIEGDTDRAQRAFEDWKANTERVLKQYDVLRSGWSDWASAANLSLDQKVKGIQLLNLKAGLEMAPLEIEQKGLETLMQEISRRDAAAEKARQHYESLLEKRAEGERNRLGHELQTRIAAEARVDAAKMMMGFHAITDEQRRRDRKEEREGALEKGTWFNAETGQRDYPTVADRKANPSLYKHVDDTQERQRAQIEIALPMLKRLRSLTDNLLAKYPGQNLSKAIELKMQGKFSANPDLREFGALVEDVNVKMTAVMGSGGQFRVTLMNVLREVGLSTRDTKETAHRVLDQWETNIENDLSQITRGKNVREHMSGPWQGWALAPDGQRKWIRLPKGERIPPGWITMEETK